MFISKILAGFPIRNLVLTTAVAKKYQMSSVIIILVFCQNLAYAQLKIGDNPTTIKAASLLEMESGNKGFVLPRVGLTALANYAPLAADLLEGTAVYNTNITLPGGPGIYIWKGTIWTKLQADDLGNHTATQNLDLTNKLLVGNGGSSGLAISNIGNVGIGIANPTAKLHVNSELKVTGASSPQSISQPVDNFYEVSGTGPLGLGQSFTMPANATITEIDVYVFMSDVSSGTFALYQGAPGSGTPLITQPVTYNPTGVTQIILTTPIIISAAGTYSFSTGSNKRFKISMSNTYAGGAMYWGTTANANSDMNFAVQYNLEGQTLYTTAAGNVGIGTTSPTAKLELNGQLKITDGNQAAGKVLMSDANGLATWTTPTAGITGITLDQAYDFGGAGVGRTINATDGAVQVAGNDGFQVTGTFNSGADLALAGAGTRMFFNPKKAAFRAGYTTAAKWDAANIGSYSFAAGYGTYASSIAAVAIGYGDSAIGDYSLATGINTRAIGDYSTATGFTTVASGDYSTAMGQNTTAAGSASTAMGYRSYAALPATVAIGYSDSAKGNYSLALGANTKAVGYISTTIGQNTVATGNTAIAMGYRDSAKGDYSMAMGANTTAAGNYSTAMGTNTTALSYVETSIGSNNIAYTPLSATSWNAADRLFTIGNGTSAANQSNAVTVLKNGNVGIGISTPATRLDVTGNGRFTQSGGSLILAGSGVGSHTYMEFFTNGAGSSRTAWLGYGSNGSTSLSISNHGGTDISLSTPANFYFEANSATRLFVQGSNGFVGVGNTSPSAMLDVNGTTRLRGLTTAGVVTTDANGNLSSAAAASINPVTASNGLTKTATDIALGGTLSATTTIAQGTNNLLFTGTGSMGIGTATPGAKLDVAGQGRFTYAGEGIRLAGTGIGSSTYAGFYPDGAAGTRRAYLGYSAANNQNFSLENEYAAGDMSIATGQDLWVRTGGSNRLIVKGNTGNVGIGTISPTTKLQVMASGYGITHTNGTIEVGTYIDGNYGWLGTSTNHPLAFFTNDGGVSMLVNTAGNVGIGTENPGARLEVAGQIKITGGTPGTGKVLMSDATGLASWTTPAVTPPTTASNGLTKNGSDVILGGTLTTATNIQQNGNDFVLQGNGVIMNLYQEANTNLEGSYTSQGAYRGQSFTLPRASTITSITIKNLAAGASGTANLSIHSANGSYTQAVAIASGYVTYTLTTPQNVPAGVSRFEFSNMTGSLFLEITLSNNLYPGGNFYSDILPTTNYDLYFIANYQSPSAVPTLYASANGNVGFGNTNPSQRVEVTGNVYVNSEAAGFIADAGGAARVGLMKYSGRAGGIWRTAGQGFEIGRVDGSSLTSVPGSFTVDMLVDGSGNVGIGTASPTAKLHVAGEAKATVFTTTSDSRFKKDMHPLNSALASVQALQGMRYQWNELGIQHGGKPDAQQIGLIAQAVETVFPELVSTDAEGFKAVNYAQLTPVLIEAIKEQQQQIEALKLQNKILKNDHDSIIDLQKQMNQLKAATAQAKTGN